MCWRCIKPLEANQLSPNEARFLFRQDTFWQADMNVRLNPARTGGLGGRSP